MAEADLLDIARYTEGRWSADQAREYLIKLRQACEMLLAHPQMGRDCNGVRPGLRLLETGRHVVFYRLRENSVLVVRVLHQRMLPVQRILEVERPE